MLFYTRKRPNIGIKLFFFFVSNRAQKIRTATIKKSLFEANLPKEYYVKENQALKKRIQALEEQLANVKAATGNSNVNNDDLIARRSSEFSESLKNHDQRGVKFAESIDEISGRHHNQADHSFDADHPIVGAETTMNSNKRQRENDDESNAIPTEKRVTRSICDKQNAVVTRDKQAVNKVVNKVQATTSRTLKSPFVHKSTDIPKVVTKTAPKSVTKVRPRLIQRLMEIKRTPLKSTVRGPNSVSKYPLNRSEYEKN